jgi:hypothetical protein
MAAPKTDHGKLVERRRKSVAHSQSHFSSSRVAKWPVSPIKSTSSELLSRGGAPEDRLLHLYIHPSGIRIRNEPTTALAASSSNFIA